MTRGGSVPLRRDSRRVSTRCQGSESGRLWVRAQWGTSQRELSDAPGTLALGSVAQPRDKDMARGSPGLETAAVGSSSKTSFQTKVEGASAETSLEDEVGS